MQPWDHGPVVDPPCRCPLHEREGLEVGDVVLVVGDAVEPREARVVQITDDGREAELEFVAFSER